MLSLSNEKLMDYNQKGLIPGPNESSETFLSRAEYCLHLKSHLSDELKTTFGGDENGNPDILSPSLDLLEKDYDMAPTWIPLFFSDYRLPFWQGGCAWIFQTAKDSPTAALIQLRQSFRNSQRYFGIYDRQELLTHELTHVGRMAFQEPIFEEILAYQTAKSSFRRWLGPILQSSLESVFFVLLLGLIVVSDIFLIAMNRVDAYFIAVWLKLIPLALIAYALMRLAARHKKFEKCLSNLKDCLEREDRALAVIYRLTDEEIQRFSEMSAAEIREYASVHATQELRWQLIESIYFNPSSSDLFA